MLKQYFAITVQIRCIIRLYPSTQLSLYEYRTLQTAVAFGTRQQNRMLPAKSYGHVNSTECSAF